MPEPGDQTEAELEKTRRVVAESMAAQIATNDAAVAGVVDEEANEPEPEPDEKSAAKSASTKKGTR